MERRADTNGTASLVEAADPTFDIVHVCLKDVLERICGNNTMDLKISCLLLFSDLGQCPTNR